MTHDRALMLAEAYVRMRRGARALEVLQDASPEEARTWLRRANALHLLERYEEAVAAARTGLSIDAEDSYLYAALGRAEFALLHLEEAEQALRESLRLNPYEAETHSALAVLLLSMNRLAEANQVSGQAVQLAAAHPPVRGMDIYVRLASGNSETADELSAELLADAPDDPIAHYCRGMTRAQRGDVRGAARHYREAARLQPDNRALVKAARISHHWIFWPLRLLSPIAWQLGTVALSLSFLYVFFFNGPWTYTWYAVAYLVYVFIAMVALIVLPMR